MHDKTTRRRGPRLPHLIAAVVVGVLAVGLSALGGFALWADSQKNEAGFIASDHHRFAGSGSALVSEKMDVDLDGADWVVEEDNLGRMRLEVEASDAEPVFVGVARENDVRDYLRGVGHTRVKDIDYGPFRVAYEPRGGDRRAAPPVSSDIWAASTSGSGKQTLDWEVADGDWSVVVMNADGSPGVDARVSAGVKLPWLEPAGWGTLGGGVLLLAGATALLALSLRRRRPEDVIAPSPAPAPVAA